jgi:ankyrin repeat protein
MEFLSKFVGVTLDTETDKRIRQQPDTTIPEDGGRTYLHIAVLNRNDRPAQFLLSVGAKPSLPDAMGKTPLHLLGESRPGPAWPIQLAELLLDKGASLKAQDLRGRTPLHAACDDVESGLMDAEYLICRGADPKSIDRFGWTPSDIASIRGWTDTDITHCRGMGRDFTLPNHGHDDLDHLIY